MYGSRALESDADILTPNSAHAVPTVQAAHSGTQPASPGAAFASSTWCVSTPATLRLLLGLPPWKRALSRSAIACGVSEAADRGGGGGGGDGTGGGGGGGGGGDGTGSGGGGGGDVGKPGGGGDDKPGGGGGGKPGSGGGGKPGSGGGANAATAAVAEDKAGLPMVTFIEHVEPPTGAVCVGRATCVSQTLRRPSACHSKAAHDGRSAQRCWHAWYDGAESRTKSPFPFPSLQAPLRGSQACSDAMRDTAEPRRSLETLVRGVRAFRYRVGVT